MQFYIIFYKGTVQYSILHIILILQCSCEQIYFQVFLFQNYMHPVSTCSAPCENFILHSTWRITILQSSIDAPRLQSTCTQTTCSLHPLSLQLNQPTRTFLLGEYADSTGRSLSNILLNQDKNSTRRSLNAIGI